MFHFTFSNTWSSSWLCLTCHMLPHALATSLSTTKSNCIFTYALHLMMLSVATIYLIPLPLFITTLVVLLQGALVCTALVTALILLCINIQDFFVNCNTSQQLITLIIACSILTSNWMHGWVDLILSWRWWLQLVFAYNVILSYHQAPKNKPGMRICPKSCVTIHISTFDFVHQNIIYNMPKISKRWNKMRNDSKYPNTGTGTDLEFTWECKVLKQIHKSKHDKWENMSSCQLFSNTHKTHKHLIQCTKYTADTIQPWKYQKWLKQGFHCNGH